MASGPSPGAKLGSVGVPAVGQLAGQPAVELGGEVRVGLAVARQHLAPRRARAASPALGDLREALAHLGRDAERRLERPAEVLLGRRHLVGAERRAVGVGGVLPCAGCRSRCTVRTTTSDGRPVSRRGGADRVLERRQVVAVVDVLDVPAVGLEALPDVLGEGERRRPVDGDVVVVVEDVELAEPQVAGQRGRPPTTPPPSCRRRWRLTHTRWSKSGKPSRLKRVGEHALARSPCRRRSRCPGRAARWWSRRRRRCRAPGAPASSSRAGGSA